MGQIQGQNSNPDRDPVDAAALPDRGDIDLPALRQELISDDWRQVSAALDRIEELESIAGLNFDLFVLGERARDSGEDRIDQRVEALIEIFENSGERGSDLLYEHYLIFWCLSDNDLADLRIQRACSYLIDIRAKAVLLDNIFQITESLEPEQKSLAAKVFFDANRGFMKNLAVSKREQLLEKLADFEAAPAAAFLIRASEDDDLIRLAQERLDSLIDDENLTQRTPDELNSLCYSFRALETASLQSITSLFYAYVIHKTHQYFIDFVTSWRGWYWRIFCLGCYY